MAETCTVQGCDRPVTSRGWCAVHYQRYFHTGDVQADKPVRGAYAHVACTVQGCAEPVRAKGMCVGHYARYSTHGDARPDTPLRPRGEYPEGCIIPGCAGVHLSLGMCRPHWARWYNHGDPLWTRTTAAECAIDGCVNPRRTLGLCTRHYVKHRKGHDNTRYRQRTGPCQGRCAVCRWDHARIRREGTRARIEQGPLAFAVRRGIVLDLWHGAALSKVYPDGVAVRGFWHVADAVPAFRRALDAVTMALRDPDLTHGATGYKAECRCPDCRRWRADAEARRRTAA